MNTDTKSSPASLRHGSEDLPTASIGAFCPRNMSFPLCSDLTLSPLLFGDQPDPNPRLQDFHKGGYKQSICASMWGVSFFCQGCGRGLVRNPAAEKLGNLTLKGTRAEGKAAMRGCTSCPSSASSSLSNLSSLCPPALCSSRRQEGGSSDHSSQDSVLSGCSLAHAGLRRP